MKHARKSRRLCEVCRERAAKFAYRGHVKRDRQHDLCFACYRAIVNRSRLAHVEPFALNLPTNPPRTLAGHFTGPSTPGTA